MPSFISNHIIDALEAFRAEAGHIAKAFHANFENTALKWIQSNNSKVITAPAWWQSSNGLVKCTGRTIVTMARVYITEKQVGHEYWYFAVVHVANIINQRPGRLGTYPTI